jgi:hypothetical protein
MSGRGTRVARTRGCQATGQDVRVELLAGRSGLDIQLAAEGIAQVLVLPQSLMAVTGLSIHSHQRDVGLLVSEVGRDDLS